MEVLKWVKDLHTKVAATAFNIPLSSVFVSETSTYKVHLTQIHALSGLLAKTRLLLFSLIIFVVSS